jgi:hypothetical protein
MIMALFQIRAVCHVQRFSSSNDAGVAESIWLSVAERHHAEAEYLC